MNRLPALAILVPLAVAGAASAYFPSVRWLVGIWSADKEMSHGFLVPIVCVAVVWLQRKRLARIPCRPAALAGGSVLLLAAVLVAVGRTSGLFLAESISLLVLIPGVVLFLFGWEMLGRLAFPLAYLQFMVPWMEDILDRLHLPLQSISAFVGVKIVQWAGIPVLQDGLFITLPNITLEVARTCSGVNFLVSVIALGFPLVYFTQRSWGRGLFVLFAGTVLTVLVNGLRVALVCWSSVRFGSGMTHGPMHVFQGWFVAQAGFVLLFAINWLVLRFDRSEPGPPLVHRAGDVEDAPLGRAVEVDVSRVSILAVYFLLLAGHLAFLAVPSPVPPPRVGEVPRPAGEWKEGGGGHFPGEDLFPGAATTISKGYLDARGREVLVYAGYYAFQSTNQTPVSYHSRTLRDDAKVLRTGLRDPSPGAVNVTRFQHGSRVYHAQYVYLYPSGYRLNRVAARLTGILDAVVRRRNCAAVLVVASPVSDNASRNVSDTEMLGFVGSVAPVFRELVP